MAWFIIACCGLNSQTSAIGFIGPFGFESPLGFESLFGSIGFAGVLGLTTIKWKLRGSFFYWLLLIIIAFHTISNPVIRSVVSYLKS